MLKRKELTVDRKKGGKEGNVSGAVLYIVFQLLGFAVGAYSFDTLEDSDAGIFMDKMCELIPNPFVLVVSIVFIIVLLSAIIVYIHEFSHLIVFKVGLPKDQRKYVRIKILHGFQPCVVWPNCKPKLGLKFLEQILPFITAGVIPLVISAFLKSPILVICATYGASTSGEDVIAAWRLFKCRKLNVKYCEDCYEEHFVCYVYYEDDKDGN